MLKVTEQQLDAAWSNAKKAGFTNNRCVEEMEKQFPGINTLFVRFRYIVSAK